MAVTFLTNEDRAVLESNLNAKLNANGYVPNMYLGTDNEGNIIEKDAPESGIVGDYVESVNGHTGAVQLTASDVGALPATTQIPNATSQLENNSGFITKTVSDLQNYYLKSQTYTKEEIEQKLSAIPIDMTGYATETWVSDQLGSYLKNSEQEDIVQQVISALQTPVFGRVDEENNIILTGELADGTYTFKYEDADGNLTVIGTIGHDADKPNYTNQIPISIDTDGTIFNGTGYMAAKRINSSHAVADLQNTAATNPAFVTGLIPVKGGDVFRFKNCYFDTANSDKSTKYGFANWNGRICFYTSAKEWTNETFWTAFDDGDDTFATAVVGSDGLCYEMTFKNNISTAGYKYVRFNLCGTPETAIITVNEPIE